MSAMFAFDAGDISMRSVTFEDVMTGLLGRSIDPVDREICQDAIDLNCLWVDQIPAAQKCPLLVGLFNVLKEFLKGGAYADNQVASFEINNVMKKLIARYPECFEAG